MGFSKVGTPEQHAMEAIDDAHEKIMSVVEKVEENQEKGITMDSIAGLLALMQNNKNLDLPGLLALCKEKGYNQGWGGEGMFMFVFLILFLFAGGGWGNLGGNRQQQFEALVGGQTRDLIALYDKLGQMQSSNSNDFARAMQDNAAGFMRLDTKLCSVISDTIAAVNSAARSNYDAIRNVGDAVRECCCTMQAKLAELGCRVDGLYGHTSVLQERTINAIERASCATDNKIANLEAKMELGFERTQCLITKTASDQETQRLQREVAELKSTLNNTAIAKEAVAAAVAALNNKAAS